MYKRILFTAFALMCLCSLHAQKFLLYGLTGGGGISIGYGTLFSFDPSVNKDSVLIAFNSTDGATAQYGNNIVLGYDNNLYSSTPFGGTTNSGILFKYEPVPAKDSTLYQVFITNNGQLPMGMIQATDSCFYGTIEYATPGNEGGLFKYDPKKGIYKLLVDFNITDGSNPLNHPIQASDGSLYGLIPAGGNKNKGVLFRYNLKTSVDTVLVNFAGATNGSTPRGHLMQASNGLLYGMTSSGGSKNEGVIFSYDPVKLKDSVLWNFDTTGGMPGNPYGSLIQATNGLLYGLTPAGGINKTGSIFSYNISLGTVTMYTSLNATTGKSPYGDLVQAPDGLLYGLTLNGGKNNDGTLFSFDPVTNIDSVRFNFYWASGAGPQGTLTVGPVSIVTSVNTMPSAHTAIRIYPNPFSKNTTVYFAETGKHYLEVDDITGRKLNSYTTNEKQFILSGQELTSGIYFIRISDEGKPGISTFKIVVN
jgi:uncharacterized repeat protein (TIGR03803 family)